MPFQIIRNDITKVTADAIVNSANPDPVCGGGTDYAVYQAAGEEELLAERRKIGHLRRGEVAVTPAFRLSARYIIHTAGPVWAGGTRDEFRTLASCYRKSLYLARILGCRSIAFPLISTGIYGFPKDAALSIALEEIRSFLEENEKDAEEDREMDVTLVVFNKDAFCLSEELVDDVRQYIDDHYVDAHVQEEYAIDYETFRQKRRGIFHHADNAACESLPSYPPSYSGARADRIPDMAVGAAPAKSAAAKSPAAKSSAAKPASAEPDLSEMMKNLGDSFQKRLLNLIDNSGMTDPQVYTKANIDRKLFSKIRCNPGYTPGKKTVIALAIALGLDLDETKDLLARAGIALSPSSKFDLLIEYSIRRHMNILETEALLFDHDQPTLGSKA